MENNDLPDFDADDLIEAMAEECRKGELAGERGHDCDPCAAESGADH
ncbi:hypothetical protein [Hyphococcus sp.]|nr:MAG: hypothetical protein DHS20C04_21220 [Marinicaulis sp.]